MRFELWKNDFSQILLPKIIRACHFALYSLSCSNPLLWRVFLFALQLPTSNRAIAKPVPTFARHALTVTVKIAKLANLTFLPIMHRFSTDQSHA